MEEERKVDDRNDEYYLIHCPIELSSTLLKLFSDLFLTLSPSQSLESPFQALLHTASLKSDLTLESEILAKYFLQPKSQLEDKMKQVITEN